MQERKNIRSLLKLNDRSDHFRRAEMQKKNLYYK